MSHQEPDQSSGGAPRSVAGPMNYGDYLHLESILGAQHPLSSAHDEMLFVIQHQTSELWMRLAIYELQAARSAIRVDELSHAFKTLSRVARIFEQLTSAWDVLRTMTPSEYTSFRPELRESSGLQSFQYREIEFLLGNRNPAMVRMHADRPEVVARLEQELQRPSLYDEALRLLARHGIDVPEAVLQRDLAQPHSAHGEVVNAWRRVYTEPERHWSLYELAEKLVDLEDYVRRWRFNHVTTVERIIGYKGGTGGTNGVPYLRRRLDVVLFPDLWAVRTDL